MPKKNWIKSVTSVSTFPPPNTFNQRARRVVEIMLDPNVSPKGIGSAIRMIQYYINRAGKRIKPEQLVELEKAKKMLQKMNH